jgi:hypothetical protein
MMKIFARLAIVAIVAAPIAACPATPEPAPAPPPPPPAAATPPAAPAIPDYSPTGDEADLKKQGAAGITQDNAATKAAELEGSIDAATKALEAAPKKK